MGAQGTATIDFGSGATPGVTEATINVTGQTGIISGSQVEAWMSLNTATSDHSIDEHRVEPIRFTAGNIVAGTGFTIYAECMNGTTMRNFYRQLGLELNIG